MYNMEKHLMENQSDINFTVVKPPILDDGDVTGKVYTNLLCLWKIHSEHNFLCH